MDSSRGFPARPPAVWRAGTPSGRTDSPLQPMPRSRLVFVYVLRSLRDGERYTGLSLDVASRLGQHNAGRVRSTKARAPFALIYQEPFQTLKEARTREKYFKSGAGRRWLHKNGF
jgi:putative endonuclease